MKKNKLWAGSIIAIASFASAQAAYNDKLTDAIRASKGTIAERMNKIVQTTTDEAAVCLTRISAEVFYRLHTNKLYDGLVTVEAEKEGYKDFFTVTKDNTPTEVTKMPYVVQSGGQDKKFDAYIVRLDPTNLCFARMPPPAEAIVKADGNSAVDHKSTTATKNSKEPVEHKSEETGDHKPTKTTTNSKETGDHKPTTSTTNSKTTTKSQ